MEILIHPNFKKGALLAGGGWKIFAPVYAPLGIILETLWIPREVFINNNHRLFTEFTRSIEGTDFLGEDREYLIYFAVPLFTLCITREDAWDAVNDLFIYSDIGVRTKTRQFVHLYQDQIKDVLDDPLARVPLLKDIHGFWELLLKARQERCDQLMYIFHEQLRPTPPHLPGHLIAKLGLCSLYSDHLELVNTLQGITYPHLRLLTEHQRGCIPTEVFKALGVFILKPATQSDFLTEFKSTIWQPHVRTPTKLLTIRLHEVPDMDYSQHDILLQVMCFMLPNWGQVWTEMGWPFTHEIQRRLRFLKKDLWRPKCSEFIKVIFNNTS
jgi:hypothetical protein